MMLSLLLPLFTLFLLADVGEDRTVFELEASPKSPSWREIAKPQPTTSGSGLRHKKQVIKGNLPAHLVRTRPSAAQESDPIQYPKLHGFNKSQMAIGEVFDCLIDQDIKAYVGSVSPIKATIASGEHKGKFFIGNATMDPQTRSIVVEFNQLRDPVSKINHQLKATVHSTSGEVGLDGTFHSRYWQYFFATILSRAAQGYSQATVERERNFFGDFQTVPTPENASKVGVVEGASATADMIAERARSAPEFITKSGPIEAKIFITETPKLTQ
jgi:hypothetical protein